MDGSDDVARESPNYTDGSYIVDDGDCQLDVLVIHWHVMDDFHIPGFFHPDNFENSGLQLQRGKGEDEATGVMCADKLVDMLSKKATKTFASMFTKCLSEYSRHTHSWQSRAV